MGCFYFINTLMKTFSQFIHKKTPNPRLTSASLIAQKKFGSSNVLNKIGKGAPKGKQTRPGPKNRRPQ